MKNTERPCPDPETLPRCRIATLDAPLLLDCGQRLAPVDIAYAQWGQLNADKSNVILVCHALTGDQFAGDSNPVTGRPAWWSRLIGPGKPLDTDRFLVLASNVLGGCMGSTGPSSKSPDGSAYLTNFPVITIADMVRAQKALLEALDIPDLFAVIGGSMGGMQVLQWASQNPEHVFSAIPIAAAARQSAQNIGLYEVGRQAIMADPDWHGGDYAAHKSRPGRGLAVARMAAHITYMSEPALKNRFDRAFQNGDTPQFGFDADFQVESYLRHQGRVFGDRFDANSYLYLTRAMDYFDLAGDHDGHLAGAFTGCRTRFCVFSFSSDWHYPPSESRAIVQALHAAGVESSYLDIQTNNGHDAFFLDEPEFEGALAGFLEATALARGLPVTAASSEVSPQ